MIFLQVLFYLIGITAFIALGAVSIKFWLGIRPILAKMQEILPTLVQTAADLPPLVTNLRDASETLADVTGQVRSVRESAGSLAKAFLRRKQE